jgi:hypothetical protein
VLPASKVQFTYGTSGDLRRFTGTVVAGVVSDTLSYDENLRPAVATTVLAQYPDSPFAFTLTYDSIGRQSKLVYPERYGVSPGRSLGFKYSSNQLSKMELDELPFVSDFVFYPDGTAKSLQLNLTTGKVVETLAIDAKLGLPSSRTATDSSGATLLALEYRYRKQIVGLSGREEQAGITGAITAVRDLNESALTQDFSYDTLGRLRNASAGDAMFAKFDPLKVSWQDYTYDQFGNRSSVHAYRQVEGRNTCFPSACHLVDLDEEHHDGTSTLTFDQATNRITSPGYSYDAAGNLTHGFQLLNGAYDARTYKYDAAGRLAQVMRGNSGSILEMYKYGAGKKRLGTSPDGAYWEYSLWLGGKNLAKYASPSVLAAPVWMEDNFYLGDRHVASETAGDGGFYKSYHLADHRGIALTIADRTGGRQSGRQGAI